MAVKNLSCTREGDSIAVTWSWDVDQGAAQITVSRLLDGEEVARKNVSQSLYEQAINSPRHGPVVKVPPVPLRVSVRDGDNEQSMDLIDKHYTVDWRLRRLNVYKRGFFGQTLLRTNVRLQLRFPYEGQVPNDLFYYVLTPPGGRPQKSDLIGYLPELRPGINEYGVLDLGGQAIQLCCNPSRQEVSRLFNFRRLADEESEA